MNRSCGGCPEVSRLKGLLDGNTPDDESAELVQHLDHCEGCQHSLEDLASGGTDCASLVRHVDRDSPPSESAYWHVVRELQQSPDVTRIERLRPQQRLPDDDDEELSLDFLQPAEAPGALGRLGHFDITEVVGRGGMGVVLKGFDAHLQRFVALKVLSPRLANNDTARKRFCREARVAASITHENVVAVHQVEREEGSNLPFLVMQLVDGESLQERLDREGPLPIRDIIDIAAQAASGLAAAHAKGLIHRDIKPANILLEDGKRVRLSDFGLARLVEDAKLTQTGFVAGTPLYMSPEQARGEELDARADIFSLGGVIYSMCTGKAPFEGTTPYVILKKVTEEPPVPIKQLNPTIPDCLVKFVDKLIAKRPSERFQTASEVNELLERQRAILHLGATADTECAEKQHPPCNRRAKVALLGLTLSLLVGTLILGTVMPGWLTRLLQPMGMSPRERISFPGNAPVWSVALAPDGGTAAMGLDDGTVKLWNTETGEARATLNGHGGPVWGVAFSPDGKFLAAGSSDQKVHIWNLERDEEVLPALSHRASVRCLAFSKDGTKLAAGGRDGTVRIWDFPSGGSPVTTDAHMGEVVSIAFSPDGKTVASGSSGDGTIKLWDANNGKERQTLRGHVSGTFAVAFSPDGKTLASGGWDKKIHLWDTVQGTERGTLPGHTQDIWAIAYSPDGKYLATGSEDRTARIWDLAAGKDIATFDRHFATVYTVAFSRDGKTLATGGRDGTVKLWDVPK